MLLQSADWKPYVPVPGLSQVWNVLNSSAVDETDACVSYATVDSIETQLYQQLGVRVQFSRRWLAYISGTTLQGNTITNVFKAVAKYGLVLETSWPQDDSMTFAEFYAAPNPQQLAALEAEGQRWLKVLNPRPPVYNVGAVNLSLALRTAPVIAFVPQVNPDHAVEVINATTMFNSEPGSSNPLTEFIQPFTTANSYHQLTIQANPFPMYTKVVKQDGKTFGVRIATPNGDQIIYATDEAQWISWSQATSYGLATVNADGTANFTVSECVQLPF